MCVAHGWMYKAFFYVFYVYIFVKDKFFFFYNGYSKFYFYNIGSIYKLMRQCQVNAIKASIRSNYSTTPKWHHWSRFIFLLLFCSWLSAFFSVNMSGFLTMSVHTHTVTPECLITKVVEMNSFRTGLVVFSFIFIQHQCSISFLFVFLFGFDVHYYV
jgi:hypothetical protein